MSKPLRSATQRLRDAQNRERAENVLQHLHEHPEIGFLRRLNAEVCARIILHLTRDVARV